MKKKLRVGILGATGMVGQRFITLLKDHPWYEISLLSASKSSKGKTYEEAVKDRWKMNEDIPKKVKGMILSDVYDIKTNIKNVDFVFCAVDMDKEEIRKLEDEYAKNEIPVVSNNSAHRWTKDVPMLIPEVNKEHAKVIKAQRERLGTKKGFVAVKPNCSIQSYVPLLKAWEEFSPYEMVVTTYQAISGAGKTFLDWPEMEGNIIPYISGEEEKSEKEPLRILGKVKENEIELATLPKITAQCIRVPVLDGHTAACFIKFNKKVSKTELIDKIKCYSKECESLNLPSSPKEFLRYMEEDNRPQVSLDVDFENGMGVSIGRLREDEVYDFKFVGLSHNTKRGAAGGALLLAELLTKEGYIY